MGIIIAKFRKKKTTVEILEGIEKEITSLQRFRRHNQELQKKFIASLILYSILLYIVSAVIFYFWYFPDRWKERFLYSLPLLAFPFIIWGIKKILHWYFVKRIASNDLSLGEMREKKKQILEDVMEKETYKKAREILEKFDPARFKQLEKPAQPTPRPQATPTPGSNLRQRVTPGTAAMRPGMTPVRPGGIRTPMTTPHLPRTGPSSGQMARYSNGQYVQGYGMAPGPPLPRPVLPRQRGKMDKIVEYLVGDGPQNRYALICKYCHSHNGMALKEEFEYLSFRCCYCYAMNPARKQRPHAPKLEFPAPPSPQRQALQKGQQQAQEAADDDDDESEDDEDEESGSSGEEEDENEVGKTTNSSEETLKQGEAPTQSVPKTGIKKEVVNQDIKFADEDASDDSKAEVTKEESHPRQEATVKGELRTE